MNYQNFSSIFLIDFLKSQIQFMFFHYKLLLSDVPKQVSFIQSEVFTDISEHPKFSQELNDVAFFQIFLNKALEELHTALEKYDKNAIERIFYLIDKKFIYDPGLIDIFINFHFPKILIDLLHVDEWKNNYLALSMLSYLIYCSDESVLVFLLQNDLIQIFNSCIIANNDTTQLALLCLGNIIHDTEKQYQNLICQQIDFHSIIPQFNSDDTSIFIALFFMSNVIRVFRIIPSPKLLILVLKKILFRPRNNQGIISYIIQCFYYMIRVDNGVLEFFFDNNNVDDSNVNEIDLNMFVKLYNIYCYKDLDLELKKMIIEFFSEVNKTINLLIKQYPQQENMFIKMLDKMLADTFCSYESLEISKKLCSKCVSICLLLLRSSIKIYKDKFEKSQDNQNDLRHIIRASICLYNGDSYELKDPSLKLLIVIIETFPKNDCFLRYMREKHISDILVDGLFYDNIEVLKGVLRSIHIIVEAFQCTVESYSVIKEFEDLHLDAVIKDLEPYCDDDQEFGEYCQLVMNDIFIRFDDN